MNLVADFINNTGKLPSKTTVMELMNWSFKQIRDLANVDKQLQELKEIKDEK